MIIVLLGKSATGKTAISEYLKAKYGFRVIHTRKLLMYLAKKKNMTVDQLYRELVKNTQTFPLQLIIDRLVSYERRGINIVIEGILSKKELLLLKTYLKETSIYTIFLESDLKVRVSRIQARHNLDVTDAILHIKRSDSFRVNLMNINGAKPFVDALVRNDVENKDTFCRKFEKDLKGIVRKKFLDILRKRIK